MSKMKLFKQKKIFSLHFQATTWTMFYNARCAPVPLASSYCLRKIMDNIGKVRKV
jgi:hypothetical protein